MWERHASGFGDMRKKEHWRLVAVGVGWSWRGEMMGDIEPCLPLDEEHQYRGVANESTTSGEERM